MENLPWVFCGRQERHSEHGPTCPGTGLCSDAADHEQHLVLEGSLAPFWCLADHRLRQPWMGEQEQRQRVRDRQELANRAVEQRLDEDWIEVEVFGEPQVSRFKVVTDVPLPGDLVIENLGVFMAGQMRKVYNRGQTP